MILKAFDGSEWFRSAAGENFELLNHSKHDF
jgi:hypothetical protein